MNLGCLVQALFVWVAVYLKTQQKLNLSLQQVTEQVDVVHQVDQIGLACGHVQIDGIAGVDVKVAEGVEASIATHRAGGGGHSGR